MSIPRRQLRFGGKSFVGDSFNNFAASLGYGASNLISGSTYGFNPVTRNHTLLEWAYRGSWLVKQVVDSVADDMTREGVHLESDMPPDDMDALGQYVENLLIWQRMNSAIKWSRLYGGAIAVIMIDGQKTETPLQVNTIGKGQFKGLMVLDRWMVWPHLEDPVLDLGQDFGLPKYYEVVSDAKAVPHMRVHHSRCIRLDGIELPYWQKIAENMWGLSVIEPLYDRLIAFDSTTQGAAQLVYKAHLRTLKVEKLRELIAFGGEGYQAVRKQIEMIRLMQSNEGLTILDSSDEFETYTYGFGGLSDVMIQFAQQLSGASQIPLVRLFGQSPAGLNATGDADIRNYYDNINSQQEARLRRPIGMLYDIACRSLFGQPLPKGFHFSFNPLWQMTDEQRASMAVNVTNAVTKAQEDGIISTVTAMKELRQSSRLTGVFSNITDEDIEQAEAMPPMPMMPGAPGAGTGEAPPPGEETLLQQRQGGPAPVEKPARMAPEPRAEDDDAASGLPPHNRKHVAALYAHAKPEDGLPPYTPAHIVKMYSHVAHTTHDGTPMLDIHGIPVTIETGKDERRQGNGWSVQMPAAYGYINGTSSPEGANEQLDCFIGPDGESTAVWLIEQRNLNDGSFDEYKFMLCFPDRDVAIETYKAAFSDGRGADRMASIKRMNIEALKRYITEWDYGTPKHLNGGARQ